MWGRKDMPGRPRCQQQCLSETVTSHKLGHVDQHSEGLGQCLSSQDVTDVAILVGVTGQGGDRSRG